MSLKQGFYRALQDNSQISDVDDLRFRIEGTTTVTTTDTGNDPFAPNQSVIDCLGNKSKIQYDNVTGDFSTFAVYTRLTASDNWDEFATFSINISPTDQDVEITQATVQFTQENGAVVLADTATGASGTITPVNDANGAPTYASSVKSGIDFTVDETGELLRGTAGGTVTITNTDNQTYQTLNGLRYQVNSGAFNATVVSDGVIQDTFGGATQTTTWQDNQQLQVTEYEIRF